MACMGHGGTSDLRDSCCDLINAPPTRLPVIDSSLWRGAKSGPFDSIAQRPLKHLRFPRSSTPMGTQGCWRNGTCLMATQDPNCESALSSARLRPGSEAGWAGRYRRDGGQSERAANGLTRTLGTRCSLRTANGGHRSRGGRWRRPALRIRVLAQHGCSRWKAAWPNLGSRYAGGNKASNLGPTWRLDGCRRPTSTGARGGPLLEGRGAAGCRYAQGTSDHHRCGGAVISPSRLNRVHVLVGGLAG